MELKSVKPVDLTNVKVQKNRIYRIGVELEGGWAKLPKGVSRLEHDGSVRLTSSAISSLGIQYVGELPSPPLEPSALEEWMTKHYPDEINHTCGMHVHQSFKSALTYQRLMTPAYPATILHYIGKWAKKNLPSDHCIFERLKGGSRYCQHLFNADEQVTQAEKAFSQDAQGHRYTVVNYCWTRYQTAEVRLLPAMPDVNLALSAIREVIDITNRFLIATAKKEDRLRVEIPLIEGQEVERNSVSV